MTLVRKTKEDAQQIWSGEEEGKGPNKAQKNAATGECPFLFLQHPPCCYNSLHENSYYAVCLGHESERVPFVERIYFGISRPTWLIHTECKYIGALRMVAVRDNNAFADIAASPAVVLF